MKYIEDFTHILNGIEIKIIKVINDKLTGVYCETESIEDISRHNSRNLHIYLHKGDTKIKLVFSSKKTRDECYEELKTFIEKLKEDEYPRSWEDLIEIEGYFINDTSKIESFYSKCVSADKNTFPNKEYAEAVLALAQLLQLRKRYLEVSGNKDWIPDYTDETNKFVIVSNYNKIITTVRINNNAILNFPNKELAERFLKNHIDLLQQAQVLL